MSIRTLLLIFSIIFVVACQSSTMSRVLLQSYKNALCIDGTPGAYYFTPGTGSGADKWTIHFQGGGWCTSLEDCYKRSLTELGSSKDYPPTQGLPGMGYFSTNSTLNPLMYNWNKVQIRYCDGGSYSGHAITSYKNHRLNFLGSMILQSVIEDLQNKQLSKAQEVVISGCSAGGLATYLHLDALGIHFRAAGVRKIVGMPDSGYFRALDFPQYGKTYLSDLRWVWQTMNAWNNTNAECNHYYGIKDSWRCMFAEYVAPFITTPIFALQSEYDSWQIGNILGTATPSIVNDYGKNFTQNIKQVYLMSGPTSADHSIFLDSCYHHCGDVWNAIHSNGKTQQQMFSEWYNNLQTPPTFQDKPYPCTACCS